MKTESRKGYFIILLAAVFSVPVFADTTLIMQTFNGQATNEIYIKNDRLRFVMSNPQGLKKTTLYSRKDNKLLVLDDDKKSYLVLNEKIIKQQQAMMKQKIKMMVAQIKSGLEKLPEAQRKKMQQFLDQIDPKTGLMKIPVLTLKATGKYAKVNQYVCERVKVFVDGELSKEMCMADGEALQMPKEDFSTLKAFFSFMKQNSGQQAQLDIPELKGVPIATKALKGQPSSGLKSIEHNALADSLFRVPLDYQQVYMP